MRVFNLAEELEKERKKNKKLESKLKATNKILNDMDDIAGEYEDRIDSAINYIESSVPCIHDEEILDDLAKILKGNEENKYENK